MEISERQLRRLSVDVDDQHRDGLATMARDLADLHAETHRVRAQGWRTLLRTGGVGATALTVGTSAFTLRSLVPAGAQTVTDGDLAAFAESVELAAVAAYEAAVAGGKLEPAVVEVGTTFAGHHAEHAAAFAAASGGRAT